MWSFGIGYCPQYFKALSFHLKASAGNTKHDSSVRLVNADTRIKPHKLLGNLWFSDNPYTLERFKSEELNKVLADSDLKSFDIIQVEGLAMTSFIPLIRNTYQEHYHLQTS